MGSDARPGAVSLDQVTSELSVACDIKRHGTIGPEALTQHRLQFIDHQCSDDWKVERFRLGNRPPRHFDELGIGMNDIFHVMHNCAAVGDEEARVETPGKPRRSYRPRNEEQSGRIGPEAGLYKFAPQIGRRIPAAHILGSDYQASLLERFTDRRKRQRLGVQIALKPGSGEQLPPDIVVQQRRRWHDTVARIDTPARKNKFSWQELVTCMTLPQQNSWLALRPINNNERCGILGLDSDAKTDTLSFDQMAWHGFHDDSTRAIASES